MSEFKLHQLVTNLLQSLPNKNTPEELVEFLQNHVDVNNQTSFMAVQSNINYLAQQSSNPQSFAMKYDDLKRKNVDSLGLFVQLIHLISEDRGIKDFLERNVKRSSPSCSNTKMTKDDLPQVKHRLKSAKARMSTKHDISSLLNRSGPPIPSTPSVASWVQRRPSMSWDFSSRTSITTSHPINNIPATSQENILINDLLNILIGLPANYIEAQELKDPYESREFIINEHVDPSLRQLVKQILPLASHYSIVQRFTEEKMRFEFGQVNNALAECMSAIIVDYTLFITQLESEFQSGNLTLHKMWYYIQKNFHSLGIVSDIATTINKSESCGGKVLSLLHENIAGYIGDSRAQDLCVTLMQAACVPYMKMLGMWIYKGIISDPIHEFLVEDNEVVQKEDMPVDYSADYWDKKYTIRRERIPKFLEPVFGIILKAGKYLNVIRQCGKSLSNKVQVIEYKKEEKHYIEAIKKAYKYASETLLDLVMKEQDLLGRLRSVKHYFLLDQGDFIVTFLTLCEKVLSKDVADVVQARLDSLLDLALRLSSAVNDPYKDDLRTELLQIDLLTQMKKILSIETYEEQNYRSVKKSNTLLAIESFSFSYEVRWPLSLIFNKNSLACYQMIFRHLFYCKYVERMVCQVWRSNKVAKSFPLSAARQYRSAFALRQRMLHCVQNLEYHMMVEVIEPHWCVFLQKISKVSNVDEILDCHNHFLNMCLKDCMLTITNLLVIITKLLSICVSFCKFMQGEAVQQDGPNDADTGSFEDSIAKYDLEFTATLMQLLDLINNIDRKDSDHDRLFNLLYRLDFNSYYTGKFHRMGLDHLKQDASG
ncbi:PREDICTED: gamma-tubulin complex component 2-like isoform X2 [Nicrophorus vespilloides]|uniref:Gamma-tubulin complex component n=1 Tax=Nicrophorus vespilloides TaxID=110193 RepID=A0ABM1MMW3_NICVS|nr:PREDICTED: gamma-tubulin complex component 2-like isoform X2 [Nicrophorus vespilloides]